MDRVLSGKAGTVATILLAEDDEALRNFLSRALRRAGHKVHAVEDGMAGLAALENRGFDLLLADVVMPGMDGIELAGRATRQVPGIRIMLITGFAAVAMSARGSFPAGTRLLSKPFHLRDLVRQVQDLLAI